METFKISAILGANVSHKSSSRTGPTGLLAEEKIGCLKLIFRHCQAKAHRDLADFII